MTKLYLIRGVPGSGKSTFAKTLLQAGIVDKIAEADSFCTTPDGAYLFNANKLGAAHAECQTTVRDALRAGMSIAVSNTSTTDAEVKTYQDIAAEFNAEFVSIIMENRHGSTNVHAVPQEAIDRMKRRFSVQL